MTSLIFWQNGFDKKSFESQFKIFTFPCSKFYLFRKQKKYSFLNQAAHCSVGREGGTLTVRLAFESELQKGVQLITTYDADLARVRISNKLGCFYAKI